MSSLKCGIVGLPNVGKSTLFNALLRRQQALVANYPFATIEPNVGVVEVPDGRLEKMADVIGYKGSEPSFASLQTAEGSEPYKRPPIKRATVEFVDIAGLVAGAATGAGLGNKFLAHIREVEVIVQVLRDFADLEMVKEGSINPESDYAVVSAELILKDLETVQKIRESKMIREPGTEKRKTVIEKLYQGLNQGKLAREVLSAEEVELVADSFLLTMKPQILVLNVAEEDLRNKIYDLRINGAEAVVICAKLEVELASLLEVEAQEYLRELGIKESGLDKLIKKAYQTLGLISFLTAGEKEVRAWTVKEGSFAPQAAAVIHSDFEKKFIKAKVCKYEDFVEYGGWKAAAEKGKVRLEGKDYVVTEGDVIEFLISN